MKPKIFKTALLFAIALLAMHTACLAQDTPAPVPPKPAVAPKEPNPDSFQLNMDGFDLNLKMDFKGLEKDLEQLSKIAPKIEMKFKDFNKFDKNLNFNFDIAPKIELKLDKELNFNFNEDERSLKKKIERGEAIEKVKNYSKSYPLDANDKIKLSNQYGKITVTTWEKHEIKVDVQIKAVANDDEEAQKLLDGVQINDSKSGDQVSFKTEIPHNNNNSWKLWSWGGKKVHKLEINYTVYMPAKADLDIENSYGAIVLPDLNGQIKIRSSYGNISAQNLSNSSNDITGSYASIKLGTLNGGRLNFSYGNVDMVECNNIKADLSYGSFKLGKLTGVADLDLSYEGGVKIREIANSFKRVNINSNYSGITLGVPDNNFDFDITTTYGGFNYNSEKVNITSKTPPDGSKHISMTRNYKGHVGKAGSDAQVFIRTNYGGVHFD